MKDNKLEVGDILFEYTDYDLIKINVVKLTPKQAVLSNGMKCHQEVVDNYYGLAVKKIGGYGHYGHYSLPNPVLEERYQRERIERKLQRALNRINIKNIPVDDYKKVLDFLSPYVVNES